MPSTIEWTDETWNPVVGCDLVSPGCTNCYAMKMAGRLEAMADAHMAKTGAAGPLARYQGTTRKSKVGAVWTGLINAAPDDVIAAPLRWKKPRKVFVNSMSDLFAPGVPRDLVDRVWAVMAASPQHTYQILTKRPEAMCAYVKDILGEGMVRLLHTWVDHPTGRRPLIDLVDVDHVAKPLPNVWLGVSVEDQRRALRLYELLATPAALHWVSIEPMLGAVDLTNVTSATHETSALGFNALTGDVYRHRPDGTVETVMGTWPTKLGLVVLGGENAPKARPMHPDWARKIRDACARAGTAFFFKQWGSWKEAFHEEDGPKVDLIEADSETADSIMVLFAGRQTIFLNAQGETFRGHYENLPPDQPWRLMVHALKGANGRLLDGLEHNEMPAVTHG